MCATEYGAIKLKTENAIQQVILHVVTPAAALARRD